MLEIRTQYHFFLLLTFLQLFWWKLHIHTVRTKVLVSELRYTNVTWYMTHRGQRYVFMKKLWTWFTYFLHIFFTYILHIFDIWLTETLVFQLCVKCHVRNVTSGTLPSFYVGPHINNAILTSYQIPWIVFYICWMFYPEISLASSVLLLENFS